MSVLAIEIGADSGDLTDFSWPHHEAGWLNASEVVRNTCRQARESPRRRSAPVRLLPVREAEIC